MANILNLVILQLIAHLITDFYFQNDEICILKKEKWFSSGYLYAHALLTFIMAWLFSASLNFIVCALVIGVVHLLIDGLKSLLKHWKYIFFADQIIFYGVPGHRNDPHKLFSGGGFPGHPL